MRSFPTGSAARVPSLRGRWARALAAATLSPAVALALSAAAPSQAASPPATEPLPLTTTARLLAGVSADDTNPAVARITAGDAWQQHRKSALAGSRQLTSRLAKMNQWQARHLAPVRRGSTLIYPFSGPDFVNAYALFPDADTYVFFSLEPVGEVPRLDQMDGRQLSDLFGDLRAALNDLVALNFFITPNMKERLQTDALQGTVPVLLAMMGLLDLQVDEVASFDPWPDQTRSFTAAAAKGTAVKRPALLAQGVRIGFTNPRTHKHQVLEYLSVDVSDHELKYYPDFLPWLRSHPRPSVLLKSASYLLHGDHFRRLRAEILADADLIVQDDTGLPYKTVRDAGFNISLFGQYEHPVKLFEGRYQSDLEDAYEKSGNTQPIPFPFGYNWRKEGKSGLLLARREP
jgi:hypothetical protein